MPKNTGEKAKPLPGDMLYQKRALVALPILVRQALCGKPIFYSDLADEMGMTNPRNMNFVLGCIGVTLRNMEPVCSLPVPPLQFLVVSKQKGVPSEGIKPFVDRKPDFERLTTDEKLVIFAEQQHRCYEYPDWGLVLKHFGLRPVTTNFHDEVAAAAKFDGGGESEQHRRLKVFVAAHPAIVGLPAGTPATIEYELPSGDRADVIFKHGNHWVAAEVKSRISPQADVSRGLFQCVKYHAVVKATQGAQGYPRNGRAVLVLEAGFPSALIPLKNALGVEVIENVRSK